MKKRAWLILLALLLLVPHMGLTALAADGWQGLYEAYGIDPSDPQAGNLLGSNMIERPPQAIALRIVRFTSAQGETVPLDVEMIVELGKNASASTDFEWGNEYFRLAYEVSFTVRYERDESHETAAMLLWDTQTYIEGSKWEYVPDEHKSQWLEVKGDAYLKKSDIAGYVAWDGSYIGLTPHDRDEESLKNLPLNLGEIRYEIERVKLEGGAFPSVTEPEPEKTWDFESVDWDESHHDAENEHADPLATALIAAVSTLAAVLGAAFGSAAGAAGAAGDAGDAGDAAAGDRDPAYEAAKVPDYPQFLVGQDGEQLTKKPDGNIQVSYPNGDVATHFPNGTVQVKSPDGTTWEEWPDGTVSTTDEDGTFIAQTPDGTLVNREANGEEIVYNPDGTQVETKSDGLKISRNAEGETVTAERNGNVVQRHPTEADSFLITSPHGGSLIVRTETEYERFRNEEGRQDLGTAEKMTFEGEIRSEDATHVYRRDGSCDIRGDDGSHYVKDADGSIDAARADGTGLKYNAQTGEGRFQSSDGDSVEFNTETGATDARWKDGSYIKGNSKTGEVDAKLKDGSYWKMDGEGNGSFENKEKGVRGACRGDGSCEVEGDDGSHWKMDAKGNGTFEDKENGTRGACREDGSCEVEADDGSHWKIDAKGNGSFENKENGTRGVCREDGSLKMENKEGTVLVGNPDGTSFLQKPDGTVVSLPR